MSIDANALANIGAHQPDLASSVGKAYTLKGMMDQEQMNQLALRQNEQKMEVNQGIQQMASKSDLSTPQGQNKFVSDVMKRYGPEYGIPLQTQMQSLQSGNYALKSEQLKNIQLQGESIGSSLGGLHAQYMQLISQGLTPQAASAKMTPLLVQEGTQLIRQKLPDGSPVLSKINVQHLTDMVKGGYNDAQIQQYMASTKSGLNALKLQNAEHEAQLKERSLEDTEAYRNEMLGLAQQKQSGSEWSPEAIDFAAEMYNKTGKLPPLGMGAGGARAKIIQLAAQLAKGGGQSVSDVVAGQQQLKAAGKALGQLQKTAAMVSSYEETAKKNGQLALDMSKQVGRTGMPMVNQWILAGRQATGDANVAKFNAYVNSFAEEYAKVMSGSSGGGAAATDSAREQAHKMINSAMNPEQFEQVMQALNQEMDNRLQSFHDENQKIMESMGDKQPEAKKSPSGWSIQEVP